MPRVRLRPVLPSRAEVQSLVLLSRPGDDGAVWRRGSAPALAAVGLPAGWAEQLEVHLARASASGTAGEVVSVPVVVPDRAIEQVVVLGVGGGKEGDLRRAGAALVRAATKGDVLVVGLGRTAGVGVRALVEGIGLGRYSFRRPVGPDGRTVTVVAPEGRRAAVAAGESTADAVRLARDLTNTPSSTKSPQWLVRQARSVARREGLAIEVRDHRRLAAEGFGGLIAVGQGSARPPRLVQLDYVPTGSSARAAKALPHAVLVGKGITFDTGGLSIKPAAAMTSMKTDMAGAAAVLAVMGALRSLDVPVRVTGLLALAENMPSGTATRPSDVITHFGGTTVEVLNTDAEGRLVLADALAYTAARLRPDVVVDLATLTGAVTVALGRRDAALYANDDRLAARVTAAATATGERVWRMPLVEDYRAALSSEVADLANIGRQPAAGAGAGSIVAALFLREFVGDLPWAHLDIAGTGRAEADDHEISKGGTGYGVRLLLRWLETGRLR